MASRSDRRQAVQLLGDASTDSLQKELINSSMRSRVLSRYNFSSTFYETLMSINSDNWQQFLDGVKESVGSTATAKEKKIMRDLLGDIIDRKEFSNDLKKQIIRLATTQVGRKTDVIKFYFTEDVSLQDLIQFENILNNLYYRAYPRQIEPDSKSNQALRIRFIEYPGSTLILIAGVGLVSAGFLDLLHYLSRDAQESANNDFIDEMTLLLPLQLQTDGNDIALDGVMLLPELINQEFDGLFEALPEQIQEVVTSHQAQEFKDFIREQLPDRANTMILQTEERLDVIRRAG